MQPVFRDMLWIFLASLPIEYRHRSKQDNLCETKFILIFGEYVVFWSFSRDFSYVPGWYTRKLHIYIYCIYII